MRLIAPILALTLLAGCATAPANNGANGWSKADVSDDELCAVAQCAHDVHIVIRRKDGSTFDKTFPVLPVVQQSMVSIYPGMTVNFEADLDGDRLVNLKLVKEIANPAKTITAKLSQDEKVGMMLSTSNPFDKDLRIRMGMMLLDGEDLLRTSSCPVVAGGGGYELWPYPLFQVIFADMRLIEHTDTVLCAE